MYRSRMHYAPQSTPAVIVFPARGAAMTGAVSALHRRRVKSPARTVMDLFKYKATDL